MLSIEESKEEEWFDLRINAIFLEYFKKEKAIKSEFFETDYSKEQKKEKLKEYLTKIYGTDKAPWELINDLFKKYSFKHTIKEPNNQDYYNAEFVIENEKSIIKFSELSSDEKVIVRLVLQLALDLLLPVYNLNNKMKEI